MNWENVSVSIFHFSFKYFSVQVVFGFTYLQKIWPDMQGSLKNVCLLFTHEVFCWLIYFCWSKLPTPPPCKNLTKSTELYHIVDIFFLFYCYCGYIFFCFFFLFHSILNYLHKRYKLTEKWKHLLNYAKFWSNLQYSTK